MTPIADEHPDDHGRRCPASICGLHDDADREEHDEQRGSGSSSALGWVRVSTTTVSPSLSSFLEMATDGSCHRSPTRYSRRTWTTSPAPTATVSPAVGDQQPAARVDAGRRAGQRLRPGQVDPDVAADRRAGRGVRRREPRSPAGRRPPATRRRPPTATRAGRPSSVGPVGRLARRAASEVASATGQLVGGHADVEPDADDRGRAGRRSRPARPGSRRPCGSLEQHVVGPLHRRRRTRPPAAPCRRRTRSAAAATARTRRGTVGRSSTEKVSADAGRRLPGAVEPAAAGGLVLGRPRPAPRARRPGPARRRARWWRRPPRRPRPPARQQVGVGRGQPGGVERWASRRGSEVTSTNLLTA